MVNTEQVAGVSSFVIYGKETTYNTAVTPTAHFGILQTFKPNLDNSTTGHRGFKDGTYDGRNIVKFTHGVATISSTVDVIVNDWRVLEYVLGSISGVDPYTYAETSVPPSMTIVSNIDNVTTDQKMSYPGSVVDSCTIKTAVGEPVSMSLEIKSADMVVDTTLATNVNMLTDDVFNFSGGSIQLPSGSPLTNIIDSVEITIRNNWAMMAGLGSRKIRKALPAARDYSVKISLKYLDNALVTAAMGATTPAADGGPTEYATLVLTFAKGNKSLVATFGRVPLSQFAQTQELNNPIMEDITLTPSTLTCVEDRT